MIKNQTLKNKIYHRPARLTRGSGFLEPFLAQQRARQANILIPQDLRSGRILDIGCGSYPYFLARCAFKEKFALDQQTPVDEIPEIKWFNLDLNTETNLPFDGDFFNAITLLAVIEHLNPENLVCLFHETHRVLAPGGKLIMTTPAAWSDGLLKFLSSFNLVSKEEINEHVFAYTLPLLGWYFGAAGFSMHKVHFGYFEFGLNLWAVAEKE